ncbi:MULTISPECIES: hypothetical protein [unclassified Mesorhizobium]|uniref:hypothetical protein n=1 Tax=unclassified Mesorhizobium TaxID=325217 RepID=UPI0003CE738F|nr:MULTISPECIES: hypothetical protein [unclassified Mesorhizobium]ESY05345.1 hypothetical protein X752_25930 [Mesorhizobium sp. LNJC398B00]ESY21519.1 hypothetical protein X749_27880 [Mesorhizobium sp. LNJC391B00]
MDAGQLVTAATFFDRIGNDDERNHDRRIWCAMAMWRWRHDWRQAEAASDYEALDGLNRQYEMINSL